MKNQPSSKKSIYILLAVIAVSALGYFMFTGNSTPDIGLLGTGETTPPIAAEIVSLLNQIESLHIDTSLFTNPAYQTLRDYSVPIPALNLGRPNPFAPVPGMSSEVSPETR